MTSVHTQRVGTDAIMQSRLRQQTGNISRNRPTNSEARLSKKINVTVESNKIYWFQPGPHPYEPTIEERTQQPNFQNDIVCNHYITSVKIQLELFACFLPILFSSV